jgi:hypothetical protein
MLASANSDAALIIAAICLGTAQIITSLRTNRKVDQVRQEVVTLNESTIGELLAKMETKTVESIPHDERTAKEQRHLDSSPEEGPAQGPAA